MCLLNKSKKLYLLLIFFLFALGQISFALTLEDAWAKGLEYNPYLIEQKNRLNIDDAEIKKANLKNNPRLVFESMYSDKSYFAYFEQLFELGGKRKQRVKIAKNQKEISYQKIAFETLLLKKQIADAYITHFYNCKRLKIQENFYKKTERALEIAKTKYPKKNNLIFSEAEIYYLNYYNHYISALDNFNKSFNDLNCLLGGTLDIKDMPEEPSDEFKNLEIKKADYSSMSQKTDYFISLAVSNSPLLKMFEKYSEKSQKEEKLARLKAIPNTILDVGPNMTIAENKKFGVYAAINMELPMFNHGQADAMLAKAYKTQYEKQFAAEKLKLETEIKNLCFSIEQSYKSKILYETKINLKAEQLYNQAIKDFKNGKNNVLVFLITQAGYLETQKNYNDIMENYHKYLNFLEIFVFPDSENL